jgi:hypothetical protein
MTFESKTNNRRKHGYFQSKQWVICDICWFDWLIILNKPILMCQKIDHCVIYLFIYWFSQLVKLANFYFDC